MILFDYAINSFNYILFYFITRLTVIYSPFLQYHYYTIHPIIFDHESLHYMRLYYLRLNSITFDYIMD
jgi:hypothetical protein